MQRRDPLLGGLWQRDDLRHRLARFRQHYAGFFRRQFEEPPQLPSWEWGADLDSAKARL
jgi:hypothetical protein